MLQTGLEVGAGLKPKQRGPCMEGSGVTIKALSKPSIKVPFKAPSSVSSRTAWD